MTTTAYQIIAVDFGRTLCFSNWPDLGEPLVTYAILRTLMDYVVPQRM